MNGFLEYFEKIGFITELGHDYSRLKPSGGDYIIIVMHSNGQRSGPGNFIYHVAVRLASRRRLAGLIRRVGLNSIDGVADHLVTESIYASAPGNIGFEFDADRLMEKWVVSEDGLIPMSTLPLGVES